jgi:hypothetical protein
MLLEVALTHVDFKQFPQVLETLISNELKCVSMDNKAGIVSCPLFIINGSVP